MRNIYQAYKNSDFNEGNGRMLPDKAFAKEEDAWAYVDTQSGIQGRKPKTGSWKESNMGDWEVRRIPIYDSFRECSEAYQEELKKKALAKLTIAEKQALGLS